MSTEVNEQRVDSEYGDMNNEANQELGFDDEVGREVYVSRKCFLADLSLLFPFPLRRSRKRKRKCEGKVQRDET